jgi:hypothetical protein
LPPQPSTVAPPKEEHAMVRGRKVEDEDDALRCLEAAARAVLPRRNWERSVGVDPRSLNAWRVNLERRGLGAGPRAARALPPVEPVPRRRRLEPPARRDRPDPPYCLGAHRACNMLGVRLELCVSADRGEGSDSRSAGCCSMRASRGPSAGRR